MTDGGMLPAGTPMWDEGDDIGCFIPIDPEDPARACSRALWAEAGRRLGVSDA